MKIGNWTEIEEYGDYEKLPAGGYVVRITDVTDVEKDGYLDIVFDIAEGNFADHFRTDEDWRHSCRRYYDGKAAGYFKAFLNRLEESNPSFSVSSWQRTCNPRDLVGLVVGFIIQYTDYTNNKGEDKKRMDVYGICNVNDIRTGNFAVPAPKDKRTKVEATNKPLDLEDDEEPIPF